MPYVVLKPASNRRVLVGQFEFRADTDCGYSVVDKELVFGSSVIRIYKRWWADCLRRFASWNRKYFSTCETPLWAARRAKSVKKNKRNPRVSEGILYSRTRSKWTCMCRFSSINRYKSACIVTMVNDVLKAKTVRFFDNSAYSICSIPKWMVRSYATRRGVAPSIKKIKIKNVSRNELISDNALLDTYWYYALREREQYCEQFLPNNFNLAITRLEHAESLDDKRVAN